LPNPYRKLQAGKKEVKYLFTLILSKE